MREAPNQMWRLDDVARDVWGLVGFFVTLQPDGAHLPDAIAALHREPERCAGLGVAALAVSFVPLVPALAAPPRSQRRARRRSRSRLASVRDDAPSRGPAFHENCVGSHALDGDCLAQ